MSALDEVVSRFPFDASDNVSRETHDRFLVEARAELELLRNMAEEFCVLLKDRSIQGPDSWENWVDTYLRTDPDRARKMGLGWAL